MKKRIISMILTLVMLFTSVMVMLPVTASEANDLATIVTAALAESDTATVTLDADVTASDFVSVPEGKTLTIEGNEKTYKSVYGFVANGGTLIVKNMNVVLASGTTNAFGDVRNGGTLTFENCDFSAEAEIALTAKGHFVVLEAAANDTTMNLTNCEISIVASNNGGCMFYSEVNNSTVNLDKVTLDTSANPNLSGFVTKDGGTTASLNIKNGSDIKFAINAINFPNVTVESSNVGITKTGNFAVFNYNGKSAEINVDIKGDSRIEATNDASGSKVMNVINCSGGANVTVTDVYLYAGNCIVYTQGNSGSFNFTTNGSAKLESSSWVIYNSPNTAPINLEFNGNTEITAPDGGFYACGDAPNQSFTIKLTENAKITIDKAIVNFEHGSRPLPAASITLEGASAMISIAGNGLELFKTVTTLTVKDDALLQAGLQAYTMDADNKESVISGENIISNAKTLLATQLPTMVDGASLRVQGDSLGIRFSAMYVKPKQNLSVIPTYGILITVGENLSQVDDFTVKALESAGLSYILVDAKDGIVDDYRNGTRTFNAAIVNIKPENYGKTFYARAYAKYEVEGVTYYEYSDFDADVNCGSVKEEAYEALADVKSSAQDDYKYEVASYVQKGTDGYAWVEEKAYSKYHTTQIPAIKAFAEEV